MHLFNVQHLLGSDDNREYFTEKHPNSGLIARLQNYRHDYSISPNM